MDNPMGSDRTVSDSETTLPPDALRAVEPSPIPQTLNASVGATQVGEPADSSFTVDDPTEHGDSHSEPPPTSLIEASEALVRELAERQASGRAGSPDRSTIVHLLKEALRGSSRSQIQRRMPTPLRAVPGYDILAELGRGSVGVVYRARQRGLNRLVALKMILAGGHASRTTLARFRAEAEAVASLQHGNIVQVYEIGECDGLPFFSLEFCAGGSLADRLDGTPLPPKVAARTVVKLARAMHYAHGCHVVHRDIKPGNILLHPKDDSGRPADRAGEQEEFDFESVILKVSDFGLAKRLDEASQTKTGAILGTPSYMAPEQASGKIHDVGPPADIYALGAVLYELLTGRPPFRAATPLDTVVQVINDEPVPPRRLHSGVPADLETIALKCLQKDPQKRYATAADLADDLQRFLDGEPIIARPIGLAERTWRWCRRNPLVAGLSGLAAALLISGTIVSLYFAQQAIDRAAQAEKNEQRAKAESEAARHSQYVAEMNLVQRAWRDVELARVRALLQAQIPTSDTVTDFRGPEWHYWNRLSHSELAVNPADLGESPCIALSTDGTTLAAAGSDRVIVAWHVADWREIGRFAGHTAAIVGLAFLPDGRLVSLGTAHGVGDRGPFVKGAEVRIWSITQSKELASHTIGGEAELEKGAVSPDGLSIAIADRNGSVTIVRLADGSILRNFEGAGIAALSVAFSPNNQLLAAGFADGQATVWNLETGATIKSFQRSRFIAHCVAFSPEGRRLAVGGSSIDDQDIGFRRAGDARVLSLETARVLAELRGHAGPVMHVDFSNDGQRVVTGGNDRTIRVWDSVTGQSLAVHQGHERATTVALFDKIGRVVFSAGDDRTLRMWDLSARVAPWPLANNSAIPDVFAIRPDGRRAALGFVGETGKPSISIIELPSQRRMASWSMNGQRIRSLAWHPTQDWVAAIVSEESGHSVAIWTANGTMNVQTAIPIEDAGDIEFSADGQRIAIWGSDRLVMLTSNTGRQVAPIALGKGRIVAATFVSADCVRLVSVDGAKLMIWDSVAPTQQRVVETEANAIVSAALSRDGRIVAIATEDRTIQLLDAESGKDRLGVKLTGHVDKIANLKFSPDGRRLASAGMGYDHTTRLWDASSGQELLVLTSNGGDKPQLDFAGDGNSLGICRDRFETLDFRSLDAADGLERAALSAARHYSHLPILRVDAIAALNTDRSLANEQRAIAVEMLSQWAEEPARYELSVWPLVRSPYANDADHRKAKDWVNHESVSTSPHGFVLKGAAFFRTGQLNEALAILADGSRFSPNRDWDFARQVFLALTLIELGRPNEASAIYKDLERRRMDHGAVPLFAELRERIEKRPAGSH